MCIFLVIFCIFPVILSDILCTLFSISDIFSFIFYMLNYIFRFILSIFLVIFCIFLSILCIFFILMQIDRGSFRQDCCLIDAFRGASKSFNALPIALLVGSSFATALRHWARGMDCLLGSTSARLCSPVLFQPSLPSVTQIWGACSRR